MSGPLISDDILADWYRRWPSILPTSVPHEQVRMLIEDVRAARAEVSRLSKELEAMKRTLTIGIISGIFEQPYRIEEEADSAPSLRTAYNWGWSDACSHIQRAADAERAKP